MNRPHNRQKRKWFREWLDNPYTNFTISFVLIIGINIRDFNIIYQIIVILIASLNLTIGINRILGGIILYGTP